MHQRRQVSSFAAMTQAKQALSDVSLRRWQSAAGSDLIQERLVCCTRSTLQQHSDCTSVQEPELTTSIMRCSTSIIGSWWSFPSRRLQECAPRPKPPAGEGVLLSLLSSVCVDKRWKTWSIRTWLPSLTSGCILMMQVLCRQIDRYRHSTALLHSSEASCTQ